MRYLPEKGIRQSNYTITSKSIVTSLHIPLDDFVMDCYGSGFTLKGLANHDSIVVYDLFHLGLIFLAQRYYLALARISNWSLVS